MLVMLLTGAIVGLLGGLIGQYYVGAPAEKLLEAGRHDVTCQDEYPQIGQCSPPPACARVIVDDFLSEREVTMLRAMADLGMSLGNGSGGPTIFDVVSGAGSQGERFLDVYGMLDTRLKNAAKATPRKDTPPPVFTAEMIDLYNHTAARVKELLETTLGVQGLYLASPSFFSRIRAAPAKTKHDEYYHRHVDKLQYGSFAYTALLYLSTQDDEFTGGEFAFVDTDASGTESEALVRPVTGRLSFFTSGSENVHYVRPVLSGVRRALTIAFTCDKSQSVEKALLAKARNMLKLRERYWPNAAADEEVESSEEGASPLTPSSGEEDAAKPAASAADIKVTPTPPNAPTPPGEVRRLRARDPAVAAEMLARKLNEHAKLKHAEAGVPVPTSEATEGPLTATEYDQSFRH